MTNCVKDALRPPDDVDTSGEAATGALLLEGATAALDVAVTRVVLAGAPPNPKLSNPPPSPELPKVLVDVVAGAGEVVLVDDKTGRSELLGRPPCLQWPALTTAEYAKKRRTYILECSGERIGSEKPASHKD